jgi:hypothetical protein
MKSLAFPELNQTDINDNPITIDENTTTSLNLYIGKGTSFNIYVEIKPGLRRNELLLIQEVHSLQ